MSETKSLFRVLWQQAEYPYESGDQLLELTAEEEKKLRKLGKKALKGTKEWESALDEFELVPGQPLTFDEFMEANGGDFAVEPEDPA